MDAPPITRKPRDDEIDIHGLTHPGKVRKTNQDHFLIASLRKKIELHQTSLPDVARLPTGEDRVAFLVMVADGVGGGAGGEEASRFTLEQSMLYVTESMRCYYSADARDEAFRDELQQAARRTHAGVLERAGSDPDLHGMATTLTLFLGVWPWLYLLQVGDSRFYLFREGRLTQVSRDQTMAQALADQGVLKPADLERSPWSHVLSSAIGGKQTEPVVTRLQNHWRNVHLFCTDGLTKHVSNERIAERLGAMESARQGCEGLLQDALDGGGTDNITIIVGRFVPRPTG
ncbi:MAG TPA: PP2C family serine/threonine-protein phosphatase [Gemmatimonadales bacterium]|jgi:protein phosphatase|nr:PP2C family serine/threonine-protein phosphatase [Gemmatimonadales bacterium]